MAPLEVELLVFPVRRVFRFFDPLNTIAALTSEFDLVDFFFLDIS